jgi:uncharacterized membrane-anchored protein
LADFADSSLGIGYVGGSAILFSLLIACAWAWWLVCGSVPVVRITSARDETFYWATILISSTLGTALGDSLADDGGLGFEGGALAVGAALGVITAGYVFTRISSTVLFRAAFILTCPLGGLHIGRIVSSLATAVFIIACIRLQPQRAGTYPGGQAPPWPDTPTGHTSHAELIKRHRARPPRVACSPTPC